MHTQHFETSTLARPERRRSSRIEVLQRIHGQAVALDVSLALLDLCRGGFSIKAPVAFPVGAVHDFRFIAPGHSAVVLKARVVHTLRVVCGDHEEAFVAGLEFIPRANADVDLAIDRLLKTLEIRRRRHPSRLDCGMSATSHAVRWTSGDLPANVGRRAAG